jgi:hypothetical protein
MSTLRSLRIQLTELLHLLVSGAPTWLARTDAYVRFRRLLSATPKRFERPGPLAEWRRGQDWRHRKIAFPETELVIDGFPGSANSFVSSSLRDALGDEVDAVSHFHHTVQLKRAIAFGVPAVVVVREPLAAASSLKSKDPGLWDAVILLRWIVYHRYLDRHSDRLDVVLFDEVVADVDVIRRRSAGVAELLRRRGAGAIVPNRSYLRRSEDRVEIDQEGMAGRWLLRIARRLYARLERASGSA